MKILREILLQVLTSLLIGIAFECESAWRLLWLVLGFITMDIYAYYKYKK